MSRLGLSRRPDATGRGTIGGRFVASILYACVDLQRLSAQTACDQDENSGYLSVMRTCTLCNVSVHEFCFQDADAGGRARDSCQVFTMFAPTSVRCSYKCERTWAPRHCIHLLLQVCREARRIFATAAGATRVCRCVLCQFESCGSSSYPPPMQLHAALRPAYRG